MKKRSSDSTGRAKPKQRPTDEATKGKPTSDAKKILELFGKLEWDDTFDYKAERSRRF
jgi:hypothetical protein